MSFEKRYNNLNEKQRLAVDEIYGPVMVIAWPGSGKTELLAVRIANILRSTDTNPYNILCLTFTEAAAHNMRERLRKIIGTDAYKVEINTFHGFGNKLLNEYKFQLDDAESGTIDDITAAEIFDEIIAKLSYENPWRKSAVGQSGLIRDLSGAIKNLKDAGISVEDFEKILQKNDEILAKISPIIEENFEKIAPLGQSKADKTLRVEIFQEMTTHIWTIIEPNRVKYRGLFENIGETIFRDIFATAEMAESKAVTAWRNKWMEADKNKKYHLKEGEKMAKWWALLEIYRDYQAEMQTRGLKDFSDMIISITKIIENNPKIRAEMAERFQWIMIDEYQDTNKAQLALVRSFTAETESPNIFAVGDDDQSIYKFQGANTENLKIFTEFYVGTKLVILNTNYRSYKEIIDFSRSILTDQNSIWKIFSDAQKEFFAHRGEGAKIFKNEFHTELEELAFVVEEIKKIQESEKNNENFSLSEIAIISRKNDILERAGKLLLSENIPVFLSKDENIFQNEAINILIKMLIFVDSLAKNRDREDLFAEILSHKMWGLHRLDIWEFSRRMKSANRAENKNWIENLARHENKNIAKIAHFFMELTILSKNARLEKIIDILTGAERIILDDEYYDASDDREQMGLDFLSESDEFPNVFYDYYFSEEKLKKNPLIYSVYLANLKKFIDAIRSYKKWKPLLTLADGIEYLNLIEKYDISLSTSTLIGSPDAVQCVTGHKSKGLEYKYVFAIGLTQKNFIKTKATASSFPSNLVLQAEKDDIEDVERLIYTIFTRAKDTLYVSFSHIDINEKKTELVSILANVDDFTKIEQISIDNCTKILKNENKNLIELPFTGDEEKFLKNFVDTKFYLSVTALQNFLNILEGWPQYFFSRNILQFPQAKNENASFGTAIHKALEDVFNNYSLKKIFDKNIMLESFENSLKREGFEENVEKLQLERGKIAIEKIFEKIQEIDYPKIKSEFRFHKGEIHLGDIGLTGAIDRLDTFPDQSLNIVDYKTGKAIDNFNITDSGSHDNVKKWKYDLQLTFYELLFQNSAKHAMFPKRKYELFFVEPHKKTGEFTILNKFVQQSEVDRLEKLIIAVMKHIRELNFPDVSHYSQDMTGIRQFEEDLIEWRI